MYEVYSLRSHWTYPSSKSTGHIVIYGGDLVVVMATVLTVMYTDSLVLVQLELLALLGNYHIKLIYFD